MTVHVDATAGTDARALRSFADIDYADAFTLDTEVAAAPQRWARAMFGDTPDFGQRFIWRGLLGLRLSSGRSPDTVAGWRIGAHGDDWIRLEAASWFLTANLIVRTGAARVSLVTLLRYHGPWGRAVWPPLSAVHRALVPRVMNHAEARIRRTGPARR